MNIKAIQDFYKETKNHAVTMTTFGLNPAQEYAINIFGRDKGLSAEFLEDRIINVKEEMTIGEVVVALGFPPEAAL